MTILINKEGKYTRRRHINYSSWSKMMHRCYKKHSNKWHRYGSRGIKVTKRWHSFCNFNLDMGNKLPGQSIGRIDNDGDYTPGNCRWEWPKQQSRNTSRTVFLEYSGKRMCLVDWSIEMNLNYSKIRSRWQKGLPVKDILFKGRSNGIVKAQDEKIFNSLQEKEKTIEEAT